MRTCKFAGIVIDKKESVTIAKELRNDVRKRKRKYISIWVAIRYTIACKEVQTKEKAFDGEKCFCTHKQNKTNTTR